LAGRFKQAYGAGVLREFEEEVSQRAGEMAACQQRALYEVLLHWLEDAFRFGLTGDEKILLNLGHKEAIMTVTVARGTAWVRSRIEVLVNALAALRRHVQPALVLEHALVRMGAPSE
jgi:hypothetical protein